MTYIFLCNLQAYKQSTIMKLTNDEAKKVIAIYFASYESPTLTSRRFNRWAQQNHVPTRVSKKNVVDTVKRFNKTCQFAKQERHKTSLLSNEDAVCGVLGSLAQQRGKSIRTSAVVNALSIGTTHTIARKVLKLYPYRFILLHALSDYDRIVRVEACHHLIPLFSPQRKVVFSDEATFRIDGCVNRWNCRIWDHQRPDDFFVEQRQGASSITVWGAMTTEYLFGPYFFPSTVTGAAYRAVISELFLPDLIVKCGSADHFWFMQDGAPAHTAAETKELLAELFQDRVVSHGFLHEWPPRSPDLTPCDFYLWGVIRDLVYANGSFNNVAALSDALIGAFNAIRENKIEDVRAAVLAVPQRMQKCIALEGSQLQHC